MDDHLINVNVAAKEHKEQSEANAENVEKSEISSLLYKGSSEAFGDSAYSSLGHSAYSSIGPINPPSLRVANTVAVRNQNRNQTPSSNPSSKSSGQSGSGSNTNSSLILKKGENKASLCSKLDRSSLQKLAELQKDEPQPQASFNSLQGSKADKVATLSKALSYIDQLRISRLKKSENTEGEKNVPIQ